MDHERNVKGGLTMRGNFDGNLFISNGLRLQFNLIGFENGYGERGSTDTPAILVRITFIMNVCPATIVQVAIFIKFNSRRRRSSRSINQVQHEFQKKASRLVAVSVYSRCK